MDFELDLEFLGETEGARLKKPTSNGRALRGNVAYNRQLKDDARKKANAKRRKSRKATGRGAPGKPKSAAHRKAISAGMKRYWASKASKRRKRKATGRKKTTTRKRTTRKTTRKRAKVKSGVRVAAKPRSKVKSRAKGANGRSQLEMRQAKREAKANRARRPRRGTL